MLFSFSAPGQNGGVQLLEYWSPLVYGEHGQNWGVAQDSLGIMYFANTNGVLIHDGHSWELLRLPNQSAVKSVCKGPSGEIFVGTINDFGCLRKDSIGQLEYQSLIANNRQDQPFGSFRDIWDINYIGADIYLRSSAYLFKYSTITSAVKGIAPKSRFHRSYKAHEQLYIHQPKVGLMRAVADTVELMPQGDQFALTMIYAILPHEKGNILVCTEKDGFFVIDTQTGEKKDWGDESTVEFLTKNLFYRAVELPYQRYAFGTIHGVLITDREGKIQQYINKSHGLDSEDVLGMGTDQEGSLWVGLNNGLGRIETQLPFYQYNASQGLEGQIYALAESSDGTLYAGGTKGLFKIPLDASENAEKVDLGVKSTTIWSLHMASDTLWIASSGGVHKYFGGKNKLVKSFSNSIFTLYSPASRPEWLYMGTSGGFAVLDKNTNEVVCKIDSLPYKIRSIAEDGEGRLWMGTAYSGFLRVEGLDAAQPNPYWTLYDTLKGLQSIGNNNLFTLANKPLLFGSREKLYEYSASADSLYPSPLLSNIEGGHTLENIYQLRQASREESSIYFFGAFDKHNRFGYLKESDSGRLVLDHRYLSRIMPKAVYAMYGSSDGNLWLSLGKGTLINYRSISPVVQLQSKALVTSVIARENQVLFNGFQQGSQVATSIDYQAKQPIVFHYTAPTYTLPKKTVYKHRLKGYDESWSAWSYTTTKEYTGLWPGSYLFEVVARDCYGLESELGSFELIVVAPWYMKPWAYVLYVFLFIALIWLLIRLNTRRLKREKEALERIVAERTAEIQSKNTELEQQQEEITAQARHLQEANLAISSKNQKITASINYAQRIQEAVQVSESSMQQHVPDSFVWLSPKDIVSGDFFWFAALPDDKYLIVAADCTGHGVPGAFMSMIGQMLLKETVMLYNIHQPNEVLEALDGMVRSNLQQNDKQNRDGMDIALCLLDRQAGELHFSGAKNPLFLVDSDGNGLLVKGDRRPIGGHSKHYINQDFTLHSYSFDASRPYSCYLFSDGFQDQFGGPEGRKLTGKKFRKRLEEVSHLPMAEQSRRMQSFFREWQGRESQLDDVLLVGFRTN